MATTTIVKQKITPPELARLWGVTVEKIHAFIRAGELRAINGASPGRNQRPRWLIDAKDIEDFERRREATPPPPKTARRKRRERSADDYY